MFVVPSARAPSTSLVARRSGSRRCSDLLGTSAMLRRASTVNSAGCRRYKASIGTRSRKANTSSIIFKVVLHMFHSTRLESLALVCLVSGEDYFTTKLQLYQSLQTYEKICLSMSKRAAHFLSLAEYLPQTFKLDERSDRELFFNTHQRQSTSRSLSLAVRLSRRHRCVSCF
jgi:hypothetical protein